MSGIRVLDRKMLNRIKIGLLALVTLASIFASSVPVSAATSNSLGISPRKSYTINPGGSISDTIYLDNLSKDATLTVTMKLVDFKAQGQTGSPALQLSSNAPQLPYSLKPYATIPKSIVVKPLASAYVPITIKIPKDVGAGSYYSAVLYQASIGGSSQQVTISASAATLVFVTVPGKANEQLDLVNFGAYVPSPDNSTGSFQSIFVSDQPKELAYKLDNQGNVAEAPSGSIIIKNQYGKVVDTIDQANPNQDLALIGQTRLFSSCLKTGQEVQKGGDGQTSIISVCTNPNLAPGRYTALLETLYGINGNTSQEITATATFWYLPAWFLGIIVAIIIFFAALVVIVVHLVHRHRKHKKRSKAHKANS
jgi:hypothetical protein